MALLGGCASLPDSQPLGVRNLHPVQLTAIHLMPRAATREPAGRVRTEARLQGANILQADESVRDEADFDAEIYRAELITRIGLGAGFDVEISLPLVHAAGGSFDSAIEGWHDVFGFTQADREEVPRDRFIGEVSRLQSHGSLQTAYELEKDGVHAGDLPITLSFIPIEPEGGEGFGLGIRGGLELPTGREDDGFGNGGLDGSVGVIGSYLGEGWALHGWASYAWIARPATARRAGLHYPDVASAGLGSEVAVSEWLSALAQLDYESSVLARLDADDASRDQLLLWLGGRWRTGTSTRLELAVAEDLLPSVSPDVILHIAFGFVF